MNKKTYIILLLAAIFTVGVSSCVDNRLGGQNEEIYDGEVLTVPISLSVAPMQSSNSGSRAEDGTETGDELLHQYASPDEKTIHDFWIIEYNEEGTRVGLPRYYTVGENGSSGELGELTKNINIIVPRKDQGDFTCVIIANTNEPEMFCADNRNEYSTLDSLRTFSTAAHNGETIFNPKIGKYLLMSGWTTISPNQAEYNLNIELIRNVSKVHVRLHNFPYADLDFKYFQWRNVPLGKVFPHGIIDYNQRVSRDWDLFTEKEHIKELQDYGIDYYIPSNEWLPMGNHGENTPVVANEAITVKEAPTHFDIVCTKAKGSEVDLKDEELYEFTIYPSKDKNKQFDFKLNYSYTINIDIKEVPNPDDPFFGEVEYTFLPESNTYMMRRDAQEIFAVPLSRINYVWNELEGKTGAKETDDNVLKKNDEWVAEVIWQDAPMRIMEFGMYRGEDAKNGRDKFEGKGDSYFTFRPNGNGEGNVVIGVRRKVPEEDIPSPEKREYLWSWHIWITDYDPDAEVDEYIDGFGGRVPNGNVIRLPLRYWGEEPVYTMDRNIGAMASDEKHVYESLGMYYQYGRKDPFPVSDTSITGTFDIHGDPIPKFRKKFKAVCDYFGENEIESETNLPAAEKRGLAEGIRYPYTFFTNNRYLEDPEGEIYDNWITKSDEGLVVLEDAWNELKKHMNEQLTAREKDGSSAEDTSDTYVKSIFDPCPPGWIIPKGVQAFIFKGNMTEYYYLSRIQLKEGLDVSLIFSLGPSLNVNLFYPAYGTKCRANGVTHCVVNGLKGNAQSDIWDTPYINLDHDNPYLLDGGMNLWKRDYGFFEGCMLRCVRNGDYQNEN